MTSFHGTQDNARPHSARATTEWFLDTLHHRRDVLDSLLQSTYVCYGKCMTHHEKENQAMMTTDCWVAVLYQTRFAIPLAKLLQLVSSTPKWLKIVIKMKGDVTQWCTCLCPNFFGVCCSHQNQNSFIFTKNNYVSQWKHRKTFLCTFVSL